MKPQRCARLCQSVCRGWLAQGNRVDRGLRQDPVRWGSTPRYRGFESRRASKDVSPVDRFVLRDAKTVREGPLSCARTFFQKDAIIRARMGKPRFSVGTMQRRLCLRADTVFSGSAPKDSFPRRDGNTQALSRRFCRNDGETKRLPYRRITYHEESYHQRKPKRLSLQKR